MGMTPKQLQKYLNVALVKNPKRAIYIYGAVGNGKSETIKQVAETLNFEFRDIRLGLLDATDIRGIPDVDHDKRECYWTRPAFLPPEDYDKDMILLLDEFSTAQPSIQNAALQLLLDRQLGEYKLPEKVRIIACGNRLMDGAYVFKLGAAQKTRFINIEFELSFDEWKNYAFAKGINPLIIQFLKYKPDCFYNFKNDVETITFACPRTWFFVNEQLTLGLENGTLDNAIKGAIGEGAGNEFIGFLKLHKNLPDPNLILDGKFNTVPKDIGVLYALMGGLIIAVFERPDKIDMVLEYALKFEPEWCIKFYKDLMATSLENKVIASPVFKQFLAMNRQIVGLGAK